MLIRPAIDADTNAIWAIMEPIIRAGETYTLPRDMDKESALAYWFSAEREVFVAEDNGHVVGTYCLQANQEGGGAHVANCGYITAVSATGRGVARAMCEHSLGRARGRRFRAMQFNFVISTNERAVRCPGAGSRHSRRQRENPRLFRLLQRHGFRSLFVLRGADAQQENDLRGRRTP